MDVGCVVIGAGAVGLSIARTLAKRGASTGLLVLERHRSFGKEGSSRNSEIIHASAYYRPGSLKAELCVRGNELIYDICKANGVPCENTGKLLVARDEKEAALLPQMLARVQASGAKGAELIDAQRMRELEPLVSGFGAVHCPTSGIVDSHAYMQYLEGCVSSAEGCQVVYNSEVVALEPMEHGGYKLQVAEVATGGSEIVSGPSTTLTAGSVINAAGLGSGRIAHMLGLKGPEYSLSPSKGMYFRLHQHLARCPKKLIYPIIPPDSKAGLGVHTCPDTAGGMRLGPYQGDVPAPASPAEDVNDPGNRSYIGSSAFNLSVPESLAPAFVAAMKPFLPWLEVEHISPDGSTGLHPSHSRPPGSEGVERAAVDWLIKEESGVGLPGLVNLVGIDSPGLTSSPAIAELVSKLLNE
ncbi:unnamed protein product [Chrysoparadoxa australica]